MIRESSSYYHNRLWLCDGVWYPATLMAKKNSAAVALGRKGGLAKVKKGTAMLTNAGRSELAKKAAAARWGKKAD
jgi:hypothetical protein